MIFLKNNKLGRLQNMRLVSAAVITYCILYKNTYVVKECTSLYPLCVKNL